jgi:hypothetical protein
MSWHCMTESRVHDFSALKLLRFSSKLYPDGLLKSVRQSLPRVSFSVTLEVSFSSDIHNNLQHADENGKPEDHHQKKY